LHWPLINVVFSTLQDKHLCGFPPLQVLQGGAQS